LNAPVCLQVFFSQSGHQFSFRGFFSDHLLTQETWFYYARRDSLAAGIICYLLLKGVTNKWPSLLEKDNEPS